MFATEDRATDHRASLTGNTRTLRLGKIRRIGGCGLGRFPLPGRCRPVLHLGGAVAGAGVSLEVLQHDELPALLALVGPAATVVLVLHQAAHLHVSRAELAEGRPLGTLTLLNIQTVKSRGRITSLRDDSEKLSNDRTQC